MENNSQVPKVPFEVWFAELCCNLPLAESTNLIPCDGPDDVFLRKIAHSKNKPLLTDPRVVHVTRCSVCLKRLVELRQKAPEVQADGKIVRVLRTCLALTSLFAVGISLYRRSRCALARTSSADRRKYPVSKP
jgi:hypothetical protein